MSLHLDVKPQIEAQFTALARQQGIDTVTLFENMVSEYQTAANKGHITQQPKFTAENDPLMARLEARIAAAPTDPNEIRDAEEDMEELIRNLNANRHTTGERIPFPEAQ